VSASGGGQPAAAAEAASARPRILVNFAVSLDGKINPAPGHRHGAFVMSRGKEDWRRMLALRAEGDAILIGASNLRADDPPLSLTREERELRRAAGHPLPARVVVTARGEGIRPEARMFDPERGGTSYVVHAAAMPAEVRAALAPVARLVEIGETAVPVDGLLRFMAGEIGARTVVAEGGGVLVEQLFAARAVDELYLTIVPRILGGARAPTLAAGPGFDPDEIPDATLAALDRVGDELYLRYVFRWS
jgi:riboflavin-specific deaminase-like protein